MVKNNEGLSVQAYLGISLVLVILVAALMCVNICCEPYWKKLTSLCGWCRTPWRDRARPVLQSEGAVGLDRSRRPISILLTSSSPLELNWYELNPLDAYAIRLSSLPTISETSSQASKDNLQSPMQGFLPPPSYESIFGHPLPVPALEAVEPPSYTDAVTNVTFHLPESAV